MLDLTIFQNRMFAAATAAAFINGLSRFALLFVFVFYFQGVKGDDPITAGIKLAPMAIGMLIASRIAGIWADRHGSRALAAFGHGRRRARARGDDDARRRQPGLAERDVAVHRRRRVGHVQQPEHGRDDGHGPAAPARHRRRRADDAAEHRRGHLDRVRARDRDVVGADPGAAVDLLGRHDRAVGCGARRRSSTTCTRRCGCSPRPRWSARSCRCCARATPRRMVDSVACVPRRVRGSRNQPSTP